MNYCYPDFEELNEQDAGNYDAFVEGMQESLIGSWAVDIYKARWVVLTSIGICLCISLVFIKLMDWFAVYLAWISVVVFEVGLIFMGYYFYTEQQSKLALCESRAAT